MLTAYSTATKRLLAVPATRQLTKDQVEFMFSQGDTPTHGSGGEGFIDEDEDEEGDDMDALSTPKKAAAGYIRMPVKSLKDDMWNIIVADECHFIKNETTASNKLIRQLDREGLLLVSATPLSNHLRDIQGYLRVLWDPAWPFGYCQKRDETRDVLFFENEHASGDNSSTDSELAVSLDRLLSGRVTPDSKLTERQLRRAEEYRKFVSTGKGPMFLLNPSLFKSFATSKNWGTSVSTLGVQPILAMLSVRRGMLTEMEMPDGQITYMGEGIAGLSTETVELDYPVDIKLTLHSHISKLVDKLFYPQDSGLPEVLPGGHILERPGVMMNGAVYRRLSMASTDVHNITLTTPSTKLLKMMQDLQQGVLGGIRGVSAKELVGSRREKNYEDNEDDEDDEDGDGGEVASMAIGETNTPDRKAREEKRKARNRPIPAAGTREVNQIATFDTTGGLQWKFYNTRDSERYGFPLDAASQIRFAAWDSPKYVYALLEALDAKDKGERLLIFTNNPLTSL